MLNRDGQKQFFLPNVDLKKRNFNPKGEIVRSDKEVPRWYSENEFILKELQKQPEVSLQELARTLQGQVTYKNLSRKIALLAKIGVVIKRKTSPDNKLMVRIIDSFRD